MLKKKYDKKSILKFLNDNPDFFIENSDLLDLMKFPNFYKTKTDRNDIISFKDWIISNLKSKQIKIIENAKLNFLTQERTHKAILRFIRINELKKLICFFQKDLAKILEVDVILIVSSSNIIKKFGGVLTDLEKIKNIYDDSGSLIMDAVDDNNDFFSSTDIPIYSNAIFSLDSKIFNAPSLLIFGSKDKMFINNKGSELLVFLSKIFQERCKELKYQNEDRQI